MTPDCSGPDVTFGVGLQVLSVGFHNVNMEGKETLCD